MNRQRRGTEGKRVRKRQRENVLSFLSEPCKLTSITSTVFFLLRQLQGLPKFKGRTHDERIVKVFVVMSQNHHKYNL